MKKLPHILLVLLSLQLAHAGELVVKPDETFVSILQRHIEKEVTLQLHSGREVTGEIKMVGAHFVQLTELRGKEYFDALVRLDQIDSIVIRTIDRY